MADNDEGVSARRAGATVWLTGLPSAGKSTIAARLASWVRDLGRSVEVLDGDEFRPILSSELGYSKQDRSLNVQRIGFVAELLARNGTIVLVPVIAPYADVRTLVRKRHEQSGTPYVEVHVATPVDVCAERDVKGLYARQRAGKLAGLTGVDDPYEPPEHPDVRIDTHAQSETQSVLELHALLVERNVL